MESKLKAQAMDQSVEVYENLLLRESGYPHLPDPVFVPEKKPSECKECKGKGWVFVGFGEDHECETCFDKSPESENIVEQSQSDAWNDAYLMPTSESVYQRLYDKVDTDLYCKFKNGVWYMPCIDADRASEETEVAMMQNLPWREVQP